MTMTKRGEYEPDKHSGVMSRHAARDATVGAARPRLASLDLLRGLTVLGMIIVNASSALEAAGEHVYPVLLHAAWAGFHAADLVFPAFVTMVGVSIAMATRPGKPIPARNILWRSLRLVLLGLFLVNMYLPLVPDLAWPPRLPGVLQRIAIVYAITAFVYPRSSMNARAIAAAAILLGYWGLCLLPLPDGLPVDLLRQGHDLPSWFDRTLFGSWNGVKGPEGYDPEGVLSTLPAIAQGLIGSIAGDLLRRGKSVAQSSLGLVITGLAGIALGLLWNTVFPIAKPIWTSSFVCLTAGISVVGLGLFHALCDRGTFTVRRGWPLGSFGRNTIAAYALHLLVIQLVMSHALRAPIGALAPLVGFEMASLAPVAIFLAIIWLPMALLDWRKWYLKI